MPTAFTKKGNFILSPTSFCMHSCWQWFLHHTLKSLFNFSPPLDIFQPHLSLCKVLWLHGSRNAWKVMLYISPKPTFISDDGFRTRKVIVNQTTKDLESLKWHTNHFPVLLCYQLLSSSRSPVSSAAAQSAFLCGACELSALPRAIPLWVQIPHGGTATWA